MSKPVDFRQSLARLALVGGVFYVRPESARLMASVSGLFVEELAAPAEQEPVATFDNGWIPATQGANQFERIDEGTYFEGEWADSQPVYGVEFGTGRQVRLDDVMEGAQMRPRPQ
jgi:hypothetical protein